MDHINYILMVEDTGEAVVYIGRCHTHLVCSSQGQAVGSKRHRIKYTGWRRTYLNHASPDADELRPCEYTRWDSTPCVLIDSSNPSRG